MKNTYADFFATYLQDFTAGSKAKSRLLKYWGTEMHQGVECLKERYYIYPKADSKNKTRVLQVFGLDKTIKNETFSGVDSSWLYFDPRKGGEEALVTASMVAEYIMEDIEVDKNYTVGLSMTRNVSRNKYSGESIIDDLDTDQKIIDFFTSNKEISDIETYQVTSEGITQELIGYFVNKDTEDLFEYVYTNPKRTVLRRYNEYYSNHQHENVSRPMIEFAVTVDLTFKLKTPVRADSEFALLIAQSESRKQEVIRNILSNTRSQGTLYDDFSYSDAVTKYYQGVSNEILHKGRIKADFVRNATSKEISLFLQSYTSSDYRRKSTKWWKKIVSGIVFVIAVVVSAVFTGGTTTAAILGSLATNLAISALIITGINLILANNGQEGMAGQFGRVAQVLGVGSAMTGFFALMHMTVRTAMVEAAKRVAIDTGVQLAATGRVDPQQAATASVTGSGATESIIDKLSILLRVFTTRETYKMNKIQNEINHLRNKVDEQNEWLAEEDRHLGWEDIKWGSKPMVVDQLPFKVDYFYEKTRFNVQRASFSPTGLNLRTKQETL